MISASIPALLTTAAGAGILGEASPDTRPDAETVSCMMKYNQSLIDAGVLLSGDELPVER